ncbi:MAG: zinc-dependent peptidase [Pseudomonadota bacterium]|nr:zinc-dependent peptidase [Pseudomonadota bacterium]
MLAFFVAIGLRLPVQAAQSGQGVSAQQQTASDDLIAAANARLPPRLRQELDGSWQLDWRDDLPPDVHGRTLGRRIMLRRDLLDGWVEHRPADIDLDIADWHPAARTALVALLHELAHRWDDSAEGRLSRDPRFRELAGWQPSAIPLAGQRRRNDFRDRSPDPYELTSPAEFFAVNVEYFLLDREYACRRPALHRLLQAHFDWAPPAAACPADVAFIGSDDEIFALQWLALDPARVYAVDYLLAEPNAEPMSRWGHSMLRLVICAPGRAPGPECRLDLAHHRVLSFRAFVNDVQISNWRGLSGAYPSRLFVLPMEQVIDEYTKLELRGLRSLPLALERAEIDSLVERAAEWHWSHDGRYYFISNNCAVETWKLLREGVPRLAGLPLRSITPTGLLTRLERGGIADASVLADAEMALQQGYRFAALDVWFEAMFAAANTDPALPAKDAGAWLALPPEQRTPWLARGDVRATAGLLLLEQAALRKAEQAARESLKQRYLRGQLGKAEQRQAESELQRWLAEAELAGRPAALLNAGYGLPQTAERDALITQLAEREATQMGDAAALNASLRRLLGTEQRERIKQIEANLDLLGRHLRVLDGGGGDNPLVDDAR